MSNPSSTSVGLVVQVLEMHETHWSNTHPQTVERKTLPIVIDDAAAPLEEALERNSEDLTRFLWETATSLGGRWPWAWIFFPECYPLSSHLRSVRRRQAEMPFTLYGREPAPVPPGWTPCIGAVLPMSKETLGHAAAMSPMFDSAWQLLTDRPANAHWACLSDPLDHAWVESVRDPIHVRHA